MPRQKRPRYLLPDVSEPATHRCVVLQIPDDPQHAAAFWGHMDLLGHAYVWGNDPQHRALVVAEVWKDIVTTAWQQWSEGTGECVDMFDCDGVAGCIDNNSNTNRALYEWLIRTLKLHKGTGDELDLTLNIGGGTVSPTDTIMGKASQPIIPPELSATCSPDELYGFCLQLVQWMNRAVVDLWEIIEILTNALEQVAELLDNVPLFKLASVVVASIADMLDWIVESVTEAYLAEYTTSLENEYACDLFCLARSSDCGLTFRDVAEYFTRRANADTQVGGGFNELVSQLYIPSATGTIYCDISLALLSAVLVYGGQWAGVDLDTVRALATAMSNDPNSDWETLCDDCPAASWTAHFDFTLSDCNMVIDNFGVYTSGVGFQTNNVYYNGTYNTRCMFNLPSDPLAPFTATSVKYKFTTFNYGPSMSGLWASAFNANYDIPVHTAPEGAGVYTRIIGREVSEWVNMVDFRCNRSWAYGGNATMTELWISGDGIIPDVVANNATDWSYN